MHLYRYDYNANKRKQSQKELHTFSHEENVRHSVVRTTEALTSNLRELIVHIFTINRPIDLGMRHTHKFEKK